MKVKPYLQILFCITLFSILSLLFVIFILPDFILENHQEFVVLRNPEVLVFATEPEEDPISLEEEDINYILKHYGEDLDFDTSKLPKDVLELRLSTWWVEKHSKGE